MRRFNIPITTKRSFLTARNVSPVGSLLDTGQSLPIAAPRRSCHSIPDILDEEFWYEFVDKLAKLLKDAAF